MSFDIKKLIADSLDDLKIRTQFIPSGLQDVILQEVGKGECDHYHIQSFNNLGKSTFWLNLIAELACPSGNKYFDLPIFRDWKYPKGIAVITTKENLKETGTVDRGIRQWWNPNEHDGGVSGGQHYKSLYTFKSGFQVKFFSNEQPANQLEGPEYGLWIMDEPARAGVVSAMNTRLKKGGIGLTIFTPVTLSGGLNPGPVIDVLQDLESNGRKIKWLEFNDITANDKDTGMPNRFGEKRGNCTTEEIKKFISGVSKDDYEARINGKCGYKSGRAYPLFSKAVHVRDIDLMSNYAKSWNNYMVMDPHRSFYPFMLWLSITPDERVIIWNEYPTFEEMGNQYYDQVRESEHFNLTTAKQAEIIKLMDLTQFGMAPILKRAIDPRFAKGTENDYARGTGGIIKEFIVHNVKFEMPPFEGIDQQRMVIRDLIEYDTLMPIGVTNEPRLVVLPHCTNVIRSLEKHYLDEKGGETEQYKDPVDCIRYILALISAISGTIKYIAPQVKTDKTRVPSADIRTVKKLSHPWLKDLN